MPFSTRKLLVNPRLRLVLAWLLCVTLACQRLHHALTEFDAEPGTPPEELRNDGNGGHTLIDFGGQWLMGRMVASGNGRELYHRNRHWEVLRSGFPRSAESPKTQRLAFPSDLRPNEMKPSEFRHDAEELMDNTMGSDSPRWGEFASAVALPFTSSTPLTSALLIYETRKLIAPELIAELESPRIGGPLYPPVHAVLYSPLGLLEPQSAYRVLQWLSVFLAIGCGWFASILSDRRIWTPIAAAAILVFPGCRPGLDLGQNNILTLAIVLGGWALASRNRPYAGGAVWGLLAFKPVWGLAFALVPLLLGRGRFLAGLTISGCTLVLATIPIVGVQSWFDWLAVGKLAANLYDVNDKWIELSRDLSGLVRRLALDFTQPENTRNSPLASTLSWCLWGSVFLGTATIVRLRRHAPEAEGFLFLGAILTCYRFMYYDLLLAVVVFAVLARTRLKSFFIWICFALLIGCENWWLRHSIAMEIPLGFRTVRIVSDYSQATDTVILLVLWLGLAVALLRQPRRLSSAAPTSSARISDSPTSTA